MKLRYANNQRGDTIIEVLMATIILGMVLGISFNLISSARAFAQNAGDRNAASNALQEQLEGLRYYRDNYGWNSPTSPKPGVYSTVNGWGALVSPGWNGAPPADCSDARAFHMVNSGGTWTMAHGPISDPSLPSVLNDTGSGKGLCLYAVSVYDSIYHNAVPATQKLRFVAIGTWDARRSSVPAKTSFTLVLASLDSLKQLRNCSTGCP